MCINRAEGSSKIHSRLEQQTSRLSQQMKSNSSSNSNKSSASSKSSPPKEKTSPASPMDDIERGNMVSGSESINNNDFLLMVVTNVIIWRNGLAWSVYCSTILIDWMCSHKWGYLSHACLCTELMAEARVMDQLSSGDSSSDSNSSSSSSSDDSSSSSDSEDERTSAPPAAPANHSMPIINTSSNSNSRHQESGGGLMNTLSK